VRSSGAVLPLLLTLSAYETTKGSTIKNQQRSIPRLFLPGITTRISLGSPETFSITVIEAVSLHVEVITLFILNPDMDGTVDTPGLLYPQPITEAPTEEGIG
jgi:hypothetical protein